MKTLPITLAVIVAALVLPAAASASTTIGQLNPDPTTGNNCNADSVYVQDKSTAPLTYIAPSSGVVTEWRTAGPNAATLALGVYTPGPLNLDFIPKVESATALTTAGAVSSFKTRIPITAGDHVGLHSVDAQTCRFSGAAGDQTDFKSPAPPTGNAVVSYGGADTNEKVSVEAVIEADADGDGFGDETQDGCPTSGTRQDDCVPPAITFDKTPKKKTSSAKARFRFSTDETATFECSLDKQGFKSCAGSKRLKRLSDRKHKFRVRATDTNGNVGNASFRWLVK